MAPSHPEKQLYLSFLHSYMQSNLMKQMATCVQGFKFPVQPFPVGRLKNGSDKENKTGYQCQEFDKGVQHLFCPAKSMEVEGGGVNFLYLCLFVDQVNHFSFLPHLSTLVKFPLRLKSVKYQNFLEHDPRSPFIILRCVLPVKYAQNLKKSFFQTQLMFHWKYFSMGCFSRQKRIQNI